MPRIIWHLTLCTLLSSQGPDAPEADREASFRATFKSYHHRHAFRKTGSQRWFLVRDEYPLLFDRFTFRISHQATRFNTTYTFALMQIEMGFFSEKFFMPLGAPFCKPSRDAQRIHVCIPEWSIGSHAQAPLAQHGGQLLRRVNELRRCA